MNKNFTNTRPSQGVSYVEWARRIKELLEENGLALPTSGEFQTYFRDNFSYQEVVNKQLWKLKSNQWIVLYIKHKHGTSEIPLNTSEVAKDFFRKYPEIKKAY